MSSRGGVAERAEELLERLEETRERLEVDGATPRPRSTSSRELADIAKEVEAELEQARRDAGDVASTSTASCVEGYLAELALTPELGALTESMRYASRAAASGSGRVLCLATGEAAGGEAEPLLPAAAAVELVHTFSLVHDDLPGARRRRRSPRARDVARPVRRGGGVLRATRCSRRRSGSRSRTRRPASRASSPRRRSA